MIFLKLGGSLITEKSKPLTPRLDTIERLAGEIADAVQSRPDLQMVIGHGSGSFGHHTAARFGTQNGAISSEDWWGFCIVADAARQLHRLVMQALLVRDLPVMSFSPSSMIITHEGKLASDFSEPIQLALDAGLIPVVHGDAVLDTVKGASIVSTEQVFIALGRRMEPERMLLAGIEPGVLTPDGEILDVIKPVDFGQLEFSPPGGEDVTGGMRSKVEQASLFAHQHPATEVIIFAPSSVGSLTRVLLGERSGTQIMS